MSPKLASSLLQKHFGSQEKTVATDAFHWLTINNISINVFASRPGKFTQASGKLHRPPSWARGDKLTSQHRRGGKHKKKEGRKTEVIANGMKEKSGFTRAYGGHTVSALPEMRKDNGM